MQKEIVFLCQQKGLGFEIFRVAVVKESNLVGSSLWDVRRLSELNLEKCGKEENRGLGEEGRCQWLHYII